MGSTGTVLRELRGAQKTAKGVSLYSRYVNRPAGRVLAAAAFRVGLTPNQVTLVSAVFTFASLAALALAAPSWALGGSSGPGWWWASPSTPPTASSPGSPGAAARTGSGSTTWWTAPR